MKDTYVKINVKETVRARLKELASLNGMTLADYIESISKPTPDTAPSAPTTVDLVDKLDYEAEHPESSLSPEDRELFEQLEPGELPPCCQEYYISGEKCRHWHKEYVNYYGKRVIGYRNTLTGGTNYDYQTLYQQ